MEVTFSPAFKAHLTSIFMCCICSFHNYSMLFILGIMVEENEDLRENPSAAAHLVHGSHENRFEVVYAAGKLSADEITSVNYKAGDINQLMNQYDISKLNDGWHTDTDGSEFYFIRNPALGLWMAN